MEAVLEHFAEATAVGFAVEPTISARKTFGDPVFSCSIEDVIEIEELLPPDGYVAVRLGDVADVRIGLSVTAEKATPSPDAIDTVVLNGSQIGTDASLDIEHAPLVRLSRDAVDSAALTEGDIVLASIGFPDSRRIAMVPAGLPTPLAFSRSVLRVRAGVGGTAIYQFLRSDAARIALRRMASSLHAYPRITTRDLASLTIFLPARALTPKGPDFPSSQEPEELGAQAIVARKLRETVLPLLENARPVSADSPANASMAAAHLSELVLLLSPPPLSARVLERYPAPIALAYRRYDDARFNVFERVLRLRDLFEAVAFFIFNVTLADTLRRLDPKQFYVQDPSVRMAYKTYRLPERMAFVESIVAASRPQAESPLFVTEMAACRATQIIRELQREFRNPMSHTAAPQEHQQQKILDRFAPQVEQLLADVEFLSRYTLVRIVSFHWSGQRLHRRVETFRGVAVGLREEVVQDGKTPTKAERDHLVLLDEEDNVLDLHPMYQLLSNSETRDERHVCVFKQRSGTALEGESIVGAFPVRLGGFDDFEQLRLRLQQST
jgi:hypothetical protein